MAPSRKNASPPGVSRRTFVHQLTFFGGGVVLLGQACKDPAKPKSSAAPGAMVTPHLTFTAEEFAVVSAACERILPKDQDPGALDANVPHYIDRILQTPELSNMREDFVSGVAALDRRCKARFSADFAKASSEQQDAVLTEFKNSPQGSGEASHYELLMVLTLEGFLGDPSYGGNKNKVGWALVGFDLVGHDAAEVPPGYDGRKHLPHSGGH